MYIIYALALVIPMQKCAGSEDHFKLGLFFNLILVPSTGLEQASCSGYSGNVLSNTNDGSFGGFQPVLQLLVELAPLRSPPNARISVNLQVGQNRTGLAGHTDRCHGGCMG